MFKQTGLEIREQFLSVAECEALMASIVEFGRAHPIPLVSRPQEKRSLHYKVIDGDRINEHLPVLITLYQRVNQLVNEVTGLKLVPLSNRRVGVNVNVTPAGGEYRWHYDRNAVTAILFLNTVAGGETEIYPKHRCSLGRWKSSRLQQWLDQLWQTNLMLRLLSQKVVVAPHPGRLVIMRGDECLHSVCPVTSDEDRINVIMAYDLPDALFPHQQDLDQYLYVPEAKQTFDPNYKNRGDK
jgi:hypothetical protein